jgi:hypothetical protein
MEKRVHQAERGEFQVIFRISSVFALNFPDSGFSSSFTAITVAPSFFSEALWHIFCSFSAGRRVEMIKKRLR